MSYYTMSNKELSQLIRKTLKENGYTSKDVSVRVRAALYDTSVNITVKNPLVRLSEVENIVKNSRKLNTTNIAKKSSQDVTYMFIVSMNMEFSKKQRKHFCRLPKWYYRTKKSIAVTQSPTIKEKLYILYTTRACSGFLRNLKKKKVINTHISLLIGLVAPKI